MVGTQKAEGKHALKWAEYQLLAQKCNITDERSLVNATEFLHDVGSLIWFNLVRPTPPTVHQRHELHSQPSNQTKPKVNLTQSTLTCAFVL